MPQKHRGSNGNRNGNGKNGVAQTEMEIVRLAQRGDPVAFEQLFDRHRRMVRNLCWNMVQGTRFAEDAEDLMQESFLQLYKKIATFRGESAFSTWLHRLTVNIVLMKLRIKVRPTISLDDVSSSGENEEGISVQGTKGYDGAGNGIETLPEAGKEDPRLRGTVDCMVLNKAVQRLPDGYKIVFVLHEFDGYEHHEIAKILGCSIGNSKSQLHKARERMRDILNGTYQPTRRELARQLTRQLSRKLAAARALAAHE